MSLHKSVQKPLVNTKLNMSLNIQKHQLSEDTPLVTYLVDFQKTGMHKGSEKYCQDECKSTGKQMREHEREREYQCPSIAKLRTARSPPDTTCQAAAHDTTDCK